jgi:protease I
MKKVLMVVASDGFRDEECFAPKRILEEAGIEVKIVSDAKEKARGSLGGEIAVDLLVSEADAAEFEAVIFVGGPGALKHLDNEISYRLAREAAEQGKILAAICIAPVILAKAGALRGKQATVWSSSGERKPIEILEKNGAKYINQDVVIDGNVITASGPKAAEEFGQAIASFLLKQNRDI